MKTTDCITTENSLFKYNAVLPDNIKCLREHIFDLVVEKVIKNENVQLLEFKGQKFLSELFEVLITDPLRFLSAPTLARYHKASNSTEQARVICDYVSGMTDDYATRLYEKLFSPRKGSIFDRL
ncbi:hypothetical protein KO489_14070 [Reinekea forsetii]|nr:hypothetical protein [Reinekea forsetii]